MRAIVKSKWEAVISLKAAGLLLKDLLSQQQSKKKLKKRSLSQRVSLTAKDYMWKAMFSFHTGELQGYCSTCNTEMDSITQATQWSAVGGGQLSTNFLLCKMRRGTLKTKVFICAVLWIYCHWVFLLCGMCRQTELTEVKLWRLSFIIPLQSSAVAYGSLI